MLEKVEDIFDGVPFGELDSLLVKPPDFKVRMLIIYGLTARDPEMIPFLETGLDTLRQVFDGEMFDGFEEDLVFIYPERWLDLDEQGQMLYRFAPFEHLINSMSILTWSPEIAALIPDECITTKERGEYDKCGETLS